MSDQELTWGEKIIQTESQQIHLNDQQERKSFNKVRPQPFLILLPMSSKKNSFTSLEFCYIKQRNHLHYNKNKFP